MAATARLELASSAGRPTARLDRLRRQLCAVEAATGLTDECSASLALGIPPIDGVLGGGLCCGALHEIAAARETETAAATGFALALAALKTSPSRRGARALPDLSAIGPDDGCGRNDDGAVSARVPGRYLLWLVEDLALVENGAPYGPGLDAAGIAPERLITVAAVRARDVLWAMEEALRCRAVGVVIGEMRPRGIDQVVTRRLALAAAAGGTLGLILRAAPDDAPSAAATRWIIGAAPFSPLSAGGEERRHGLGPPRLAARLVRNRRGHLGAWIVEWNSVEQRFELATHSEPVAGAVFDRPHRTAVA
jgi:protein ImuA